MCALPGARVCVFNSACHTNSAHTQIKHTQSKHACIQYTGHYLYATDLRHTDLRHTHTHTHAHTHTHTYKRHTATPTRAHTELASGSGSIRMQSHLGHLGLDPTGFESVHGLERRRGAIKVYEAVTWECNRAELSQNPALS